MAAAQDIAIYQPDAQVGELKLWRAPEEVLIEAQQAAEALQKRIAGKLKPVMFNGEQYIENDDWQMLAHFFGYSPKIISTEFVTIGETRGFKAIAELVNEHTSKVVGRGEALCLEEEDNWGDRTKYEWRDVLDAHGQKIWENHKPRRERIAVGVVTTPWFQLMSMAETRACNKAMSNKLKWVVSIAGYAVTPAEDMHEPTLAPKPGPAAATLPTEIRKKESASVPLTPQSSSQSSSTSSGAASTNTSAPVVPQRGRAASGPTPSPAPPAGRQIPNRNVRVITDPQARRFYAIRKESGWSDQETKRYLLDTFGTEDDHQIPANRYEEACRWARNF